MILKNMTELFFFQAYYTIHLLLLKTKVFKQYVYILKVFIAITALQAKVITLSWFVYRGARPDLVAFFNYISSFV